MTTEQEFDLAIQIVQSCTATLNCGCAFNETQAIHLRMVCRRFIVAFEKLQIDE